MRSLIGLSLLLLAPRSALGAEIEPLLTYQHTSDITRGPPFNGKPEPQQDYIGFGVTIRWKRTELDLTHGRKVLDCNYRQTSVTASGCRFESGTELGIRYYPWRDRR